jgi:hypothetical protein
MPENVYATPSQHAVEDRALALLERPELERARMVVDTLFRNVHAWPDRDQMDRYAGMIDEYMFHHAFRAANCDPNFPEVARFMAPPHRWLGRDVPGSRWGGDSPDFIYRTIPIGHGGRYVIRGRQTCAEAPLVFWSLMADTTAAPQTQALLESQEMDIAPDGSFTITVDETPANGRSNHLQSKPGAEFIMVRDALGDWLEQSPNALTVERLNPASGPKSVEDMARHAAKIAIEGVYYTYYCMQSSKGQAPNTVRPPMSSAIFGAVATQWGTKGHLDLAEDEVIVIRSNHAGANFRNLVLTDVFYLSLNYWSRTGSLNMKQMAADEDGDFTFVIAHHDPGVHNWLDTGGVRRMNFGQRWQGFPPDAVRSDPWMTTQLVKFDDLDKHLPAGVRRIDAIGRHQQITAREAGFATRLDERV